jgi:hypothetical protein
MGCVTDVLCRVHAGHVYLRSAELQPLAAASKWQQRRRSTYDTFRSAGPACAMGYRESGWPFNPTPDRRSHVTSCMRTAVPWRVARSYIPEYTMRIWMCMQVEVEKPLGLKLKPSKAAGGGCVVAVRIPPNSRVPQHSKSVYGETHEL